MIGIKAETRRAPIHNHGHEWPGGGRTRLPEAVVGPTNTNAYDATTSAWTFLQRWRLR